MIVQTTFQSTLPVGGATQKCVKLGQYNDFNPRSPWGERLVKTLRIRQNHDFNPRSPWGERPFPIDYKGNADVFQSTLPVGGATGEDIEYPEWVEISIHAPRGGSDSALGSCGTGRIHFNPRSPWGERPSFPSITP